MPIRFSHLSPMRTKQRGASLIELMVGITIGLLTITVALGALMVSRGVSGTVSEASQLQQQASYAFRVIGQQLRQAGGRQLDPDSPPEAQTDLITLSTAMGSTPPVSGIDDPGDGEYTLTINYQNVKELLNASDPTKTPVSNYQIRDCLQENPGDVKAPILRSQLKRNAADNTLICNGSSDNGPQALIENVTDFTVRYLVQAEISGAAPTYQYVDAATASASWVDIYAVQICLELEGTENISTIGATYTKCDGSTASRGNRLRMVFNNTYHIRNHRWMGI